MKLMENSADTFGRRRTDLKGQPRRQPFWISGTHFVALLKDGRFFPAFPESFSRDYIRQYSFLRALNGPVTMDWKACGLPRPPLVISALSWGFRRVQFEEDDIIAVWVSISVLLPVLK